MVLPCASLRGPLTMRKSPWRHLGDGEQRLFRRVAEDGKHGHAGAEIDGIVAPFAGRHAFAVEVEQLAQFAAVENDELAAVPLSFR